MYTTGKLLHFFASVVVFVGWVAAEIVAVLLSSVDDDEVPKDTCLFASIPSPTQ